MKMAMCFEFLHRGFENSCQNEERTAKGFTVTVAYRSSHSCPVPRISSEYCFLSLQMYEQGQSKVGPLQLEHCTTRERLAAVVLLQCCSASSKVPAAKRYPECLVPYLDLLQGI
jgi:hypothetical protein